jgi:hypothetical protein
MVSNAVRDHSKIRKNLKAMIIASLCSAAYEKNHEKEENDDSKIVQTEPRLQYHSGLWPTTPNCSPI